MRKIAKKFCALQLTGSIKYFKDFNVTTTIIIKSDLPSVLPVNSPLQVCMLSPSPPPYGGISHWTSLVMSYAYSRTDVQITLINTAPSWRSVHSNSVLLRAVGGGIQLLRDIFRLYSVLRSRQVDVIYLPTSGGLAAVRDVAVYFVATVFRVPLVYHIHFGRVPSIAQANNLEWGLLRKVMLRANAVVAIDGFTYKAISQYSNKINLHLIPNCVNLAMMPKSTLKLTEIKTVLFVGWVIATKGIVELLQAWQQINLAGWRLEIIGTIDSAYMAELRLRFPLDSIEFFGELPHAQTMVRMAQCDLFVLPSYSEGFPNVVLEAMALGKPILATNVGAIPEMLQEDAGVLVESRSVELLAAALQRLMCDEILRERIGFQAKNRAQKNYTIDVVFNSYIQLWKLVAYASDKKS